MTTPPLAMPQVIGDYRVQGVLGSGGMGVVYLAEHVGSGRQAAVKTVRAATEATLESLRREIQMLRELRHPGVVSILDHGMTGGTPWYAMELLRGRTLRDDFAAWYPDRPESEGGAGGTGGAGSAGSGRGSGDVGATRDLAAAREKSQGGESERGESWAGKTVSVASAPGMGGAGSGAGRSLADGSGQLGGAAAGTLDGIGRVGPVGPLGDEEVSSARRGVVSARGGRARTSMVRVARLFCKICDALAYVHGQGIIHRDLSPSNVFLVRDQHPVLFDFGLAAQVRTASGRDVIEVGGLLRGTAHYMAPEQARGEIVDARADLYSLGCILYEAITGRPPFLAESAMAVLMRHVEDAPLPPSAILAADGAAPIPAELEALVLQMLAKRPGDRVGYAEDVAARLGGLLDGLAVEERAAGGAERGREASSTAEAPGPEGASGTLRASTSSDGLRAGLVSRPRPYVYRAGLAGRTALLERLDGALLQQGRGDGGCAVLIGESGVGKSRLAGELATRARGHDVTVLVGECEPIGEGELRGAPLHPLRPLLRLLAEKCREGGPEETARLLGTAGGVLSVYEPALAELVPPLSDRVDPATARFRVLAVLGDAIGELTRDAPILLVLDDLQWADELTLALLASLGSTQRGLLLLGTVRAEEMTGELEAVLGSIDAVTVEVPRLSTKAVGAMVRDMLALEEEVPALTALVASRSEGNPWLVAEYLRAAIEEGALHRELGGRWQLRAEGDARLERLPVPGSVQSLVQRRMQALSADARQLARTAAVLGRVCDAGLLSATAGRSAEEVRGQLVELIQRQVMHELGDGQVRFTHDRLREYAYGELSLLTRRQLHRQAALALEARLGEGAALVPRLSELAMHWERAAELARAAHYLERGAEHALGTAAFGEARSLLRRLLELPLVVPSARSARWDRWLGEACFALGDLPAAATYAQQSLDQLGCSLPGSSTGWATSIGFGISRQLWRRLTRSFARKVADAEAVAEVAAASTALVEPGHVGLVRAHRVGAAAAPGEVAATAEEQALAEVARLADAALASARMTSYYFFNNDSLGVVGASLQAINLAERAGGRVPVAEIYAQLGYIAKLAKLGAVSRGYFARAHATARATRDGSGLTWAHFCEAAAAIGSAAWEEARLAGRQGLAMAESLRNPQDVEVAHTILGHCDFATGDYAAAMSAARTLYASAHARSNPQHEAWGIYTQARSSLYLGQLDDALGELQRAMEMLDGIADQASQILCGGMLACALARAGRLDEARTLADLTRARIGGKVPPVFTIAEGFVGTAETYLEVWRRGDASVAPQAWRAIGDVARLAGVFANAAPAAAWLAGLAHSLEGRGWRARRQLRRALAIATRFAMPYDQAMAHHGLSLVSGGSRGDADQHAQEAARLFGQLGCSWHLERFCALG